MSQRPGGAQPPPNMPPNKFKVTGQQELPVPGPDGRLVDGYKISFTTEGGVNASVLIPRALYTPANVQAAIAAHAHQLDQVGAMGN